MVQPALPGLSFEPLQAAGWDSRPWVTPVELGPQLGSACRRTCLETCLAWWVLFFGLWDPPASLPPSTQECLLQGQCLFPSLPQPPPNPALAPQSSPTETALCPPRLHSRGEDSSSEDSRTLGHHENMRSNRRESKEVLLRVHKRGRPNGRRRGIGHCRSLTWEPKCAPWEGDTSLKFLVSA